MRLPRIRLRSSSPRPGADAQDAQVDSSLGWAGLRTPWRRDASPHARQPKREAGVFPGLDLLRGFAAVSVVVYHVIEFFAWHDFPSNIPLASWFRVGGLGVDLFFVISGLVITLSLMKLGDRDPVGYHFTYVRRRLARILPLHYLTCIAYIALITPVLVHVPWFPTVALKYLTFTHNWSSSTFGLINGQNWSLGVEMQFYVLLLLAAPLLRRAHPVSVLLVLVAASWVWRAMAFGHYCGQFNGWLNLTWFATAQLPGTLDEFAFGIALALVFHRDRQGRVTRFLRSTRWVWPLAAALLFKLTMRIYFENNQYWNNPSLVIFWRTLLGASCALLVISACAIDDDWFVRLTAPLRYLGTISYGIYLWQYLVILLLKPHLSANPPLACAATLALTFLLAALSWHFFESLLLERFGKQGDRSSIYGLRIREAIIRKAGSGAAMIPGWIRPLRDRMLRVVTDPVGLLENSWAPTLFVLIAILPVVRRLRHPTLLGDDIQRLVDLIEHPLSSLLFRGFNEHVAPFFETVSWLTWQAIGHDLKAAPLGYCIASVTPWLLLLVTLGAWLIRETGSRTASLVALALVAQSPLALESMWWYSASSFTWAVLGVQIAVLGASLLAVRPRVSLLLIGLGSALGPAATSLGVLAAPLSALRVVLDNWVSRSAKVKALAAALGGLVLYMAACELGGTGWLTSVRQRNNGMANLVAGLSYAVTAPGRVLWPATLGVPISRTIETMPPWLNWGMGIGVLAATALAVFRHRVPWNRRLALIGAAMIYLSYSLTYSSRAGLVVQGRWTESQLLYVFGGRYHLLPLMGLAALLACLLAAWPWVRRQDAFSFQPAILGIVVGLTALQVYRGEEDHWRWMMRCLPDQKATMSALERLRRVAEAEGVPRDQLLRVFDPALRPWNACLLHSYPPAFPLMKLVQAFPTVQHPLSDDAARNRLLARLSSQDRQVLGAGACASMSPGRPAPDSQTVAIARLVEVQQARETSPGHYRWVNWPSYLEYEVETPPGARFLSLPGFAADQDVRVSWSDDSGQWRPLQHVYWLHSPPANAPAVIDLKRLTNWPSGRVRRIRIEFTEAGEVALHGSPRLVR
jgi:peptidoglycan/LPS O-acetylase OafA/YrhL